MSFRIFSLASFSRLPICQFQLSFRRTENGAIDMITDSPKLESNLAEEFPHLTHAPVVEAVIEIRARAQVPWEEAAITQIIKPKLPDYPNVVSQGQVQQQITFGEKEPKTIVHDLGWHGLNFQSADGKKVAQFNRDGFLFGRLQPYQNWEDLFGEATRLWQLHFETAKPLEFQRVGLRFINRIEMQPGEVRCEEYIHLPPHPTKGLELPLLGFFHQDTLAVPDGSFAVNIIRTFQPSATTTAGGAIILDIDVFTPTAIAIKSPDLAQYLPQMRWLKNKVFFGNITEKALNRFK